jgi:hypothetical protein
MRKNLFDVLKSGQTFVIWSNFNYIKYENITVKFSYFGHLGAVELLFVSALIVTQIPFENSTYSVLDRGDLTKLPLLAWP